MGFTRDKYAMNDRRIHANCSRLARFSGIRVRLVVPSITHEAAVSLFTPALTLYNQLTFLYPEVVRHYP